MKLKFSLTIIFCVIHTAGVFGQIFESAAEPVTGNFFNPSWAWDSETFSVVIGDDNSTRNKLMIGKVIEATGKIEIRQVFNEKKKKGPGSRQKVNIERSPGWIRDFNDPGAQLMLTIQGKDYQLKGIYVEPNLETMEPKNGLIKNKDKINTIIAGEPRSFTLSDESLFFVSLADLTRIIRTQKGDRSDIERLDVEFELPIFSMSVTAGGNRLLVVNYIETRYAVHDIHLGEDGVQIIENKAIKLPETNLYFINGLRHASKYDRFALLATDEEMESENKASLYIHDETGFYPAITCFRQSSESALFILPTIQWHPVYDRLYYLEAASGNRTLLNYWDGDQSHSAGLDLDNIRDFKFSPDGKYLMVLTFSHELHVFKVS